MDVSIIIVNWNSEEYLLRCIPSIHSWTREVSFEIIVVDNASPSGGADHIKQRFPEIKLIKSGRNLGFAGANNLGVRHSSGDYLLFLNPDTVLNSPAIDTIIGEAHALPDAGVVGCKLLNADLSVQTSSIMSFPRIWNSLVKVEYLRLRWPKLFGIGILFSAGTRFAEVEAVSGACMALPRKVFEQLGGFSEEYFMYSEDLDLCWQAVRAGLKNYCCGSVHIVHYGGRSSPRPWQTAMKTKAQLLFCQRNYGRFYSALYRLAMVLNAGVRLALLAAVRLFARLFRMKRPLDATWSRWAVMLKTLVTRSHRVRGQSVLPTASDPGTV